ncbi:MAG: PLP-dependent aminotransferase family protein [Lachnospiraceae bacterium]|nr:PLP-dependent aminotransferase family protein [Lachnospiraceae bacterium]MBQ6994562.1 PLP-dependent aminotransferase family protein [Lachnospiraceae bacterium]
MPVNSFENYPMSWKPILTDTKKPIYIYLADTLEADILSGKLTPGTKLPPQRELADFLDINLSTITRAFKLCEQRGLICSVVGNGTYISSDAASNSMLMLNNPTHNIIEMGAILPNVEFNKYVSAYLQTMATEPDFYKLLQYGTIEYDDLQIQAAQHWLSCFSLSSSKEHILYSTGSQNAIFATLSALFQAGDRIATMPTTYPGLKVAAKILGIHLVPLHLEEGNITENVLQYAQKTQNVKGFYFIPDFHNPTSELLSIETRKLIANFCKKEKMAFIEDAIYSLFLPTPLPSITSFSPNQGIFISSTSKVLAPGLRLAVIHCPQTAYPLIKESLYGMQIAPPALMMQLFTRIILSGRFDEIRRLRIQDLEHRNQLFDEMIKDCENTGDFHSPIRWIQIPKHMTPAQFEALALSHNLQVYGADRFIVGSEAIPNAIRVSLISTEKIEDYKTGLQILRELLFQKT